MSRAANTMTRRSTGGSDSLPRAFWGLWVITVVGWAGRFVMPFLTLFLTVEAGYPPATAGAIMSMFGLGGVVAVVLTGVLVDRFGPRAMLVCSLAGTAVTSVLLALATAGPAIAALVLLLGFVSQAMAPALNSLVAAIVPARNLRRAYSLVFVGLNLGFAAGPIGAGFLAEVSFRLIFVAEASLMIFAVVIALVFVPAIPLSHSPEAPAGRRLSGRLIAVLRDRVFLQFAVWNVAFMVVYLQSTSFSFAAFIGPLLGGLALGTIGSAGLWLCCGAVGLIVAIGRWRSSSPVEGRLGE